MRQLHAHIHHTTVIILLPFATAWSSRLWSTYISYQLYVGVSPLRSIYLTLHPLLFTFSLPLIREGCFLWIN